ncbi:MAG TPA: hypothetical protein VLI06_11265 [Solimonas sp.]|nr:hypothetical protein [Solimonas sp.]
MRSRFRHSLILALVLLLGQWLSFAHEIQHPALDSDVDCQLCVHAQNLASGAAPTASGLPVLAATTEAPLSLAAPAPKARAAAQTRIRGPPSLLV